MYDTFLHIMLKRKKYLVLAVIAGIAVGVLLSLILPKKYVVGNGLRIGQFMGVPLELAEYTKQRFRQVGFLADAYEAAGLVEALDMPRDLYPRTVKITIENDFNKQSNIDTLLFSTEADDPKLALAMNKALSDHLIRLHGERLSEGRALRTEEIKDWRNEMVVTNEKIAAMEQNLSNASRNVGAKDASIFMTTSKIEEMRSLLFHMREKIHFIKLKAENPVESFNTETISNAREPERPAFPKLSLMVAGGFLLASMGWVFWCWVEFMLAEVPAARRRVDSQAAEAE